MKHLLLIAALLLAGCAPIGGHRDNVTPSKGSTLTKAARTSATGYSHGLAEVARKIADDAEAGKFKGWADLYDALQAATKAARETNFAGWEDAITERLNPATEPYDAAKAAQALRESADGWEGVK